MLKSNEPTILVQIVPSLQVIRENYLFEFKMINFDYTLRTELEEYFFGIEN